MSRAKTSSCSSSGLEFGENMSSSPLSAARATTARLGRLGPVLKAAVESFAAHLGTASRRSENAIYGRTRAGESVVFARPAAFSCRRPCCPRVQTDSRTRHSTFSRQRRQPESLNAPCAQGSVGSKQGDPGNSSFQDLFLQATRQHVPMTSAVQMSSLGVHSRAVAPRLQSRSSSFAGARHALAPRARPVHACAGRQAQVSSLRDLHTINHMILFCCRRASLSCR